MANCKKIRNLKREVCIGALDRLIEIHRRAITPPVLCEVDYGESFTLLHTVWANITTTDRVTEFDQTNVVRLATHIFIIRFESNVTAESWIEFDNLKFDILRTENLEHRSDYLKLVCTQRGLANQPSNFA